MSITNLIYTIPLPEALVDMCVESFARGTGWRDDSADTQLEHSRKALNEHVNSTISRYNSTQAAEAAREAVLAQSAAALGTIETTLTVE